MSEWDDKYKDLNNQQLKSNLLFGSGSVLSLGGAIFLLVFFADFKEFIIPEEIDWQALFISAVLFLVGIPMLKKGNALKIQTKEKNFLIFWKAYKMLEKFHERRTDEDMKNAKKSINRIESMFSGWFSESAPKSISGITAPITDNLSGKIIPLIKEKNYQQISSLATGFMNIALQLYNKEIDEDFLKQFKERLESFPEPTTKGTHEIIKESKWQKYPILKVFWIGIIAGVILYLTLTSYMGMEPGQALLGSFIGGVGLTAMIIQGIKKK